MCTDVIWQNCSALAGTTAFFRSTEVCTVGTLVRIRSGWKNLSSTIYSHRS